MTLRIALLSLSLLSTLAHAGEPDEPTALQSEAKGERVSLSPDQRLASQPNDGATHYYGAGVIVADVLGIGMATAGLSSISRGGSVGNIIIGGVGAPLYLFAGATAHAAHSSYGKAVGSFFLRSGMAAGGFFLGFALQTSGKDANGAVAGSVLGMLGAAVLDHALLLREPIAPAGRRTPGPSSGFIRPNVAVAPGGAFVGAFGAF